MLCFEVCDPQLQDLEDLSKDYIDHNTKLRAACWKCFEAVMYIYWCRPRVGNTTCMTRYVCMFTTNVQLCIIRTMEVSLQR